MSFNLKEIFNQNGNQPLIVGEYGNYSFADVWQKAQVVAHFLKQIGVEKNQRVGLLMEKSPDTFFNIIGLWMIGGVPALISPKAANDELEYFKNTGELKTILKPRSVSGPKIKNFDLTGEKAITIFTSGSTGAPKAIDLSFYNLYLSAQGSIEFYGIDKSDSYLISLPLNHVGGMMPFIRSLFSGASCIISKLNLKDSILKYRPTLLSLVPTQIIGLTDLEPLKKAKAILIGGDKLPLKYLNKCTGLPISITYGLSESAAQVAASIPGTKDMQVLPYRKVLINELGQIGINLSKDEIFWTQDLGELKGNKLKVFGRLDDIFICGGENIMPLEIENAMLEIDHVERAKVIPIKDEKYGNIPFAFYRSKETLDISLLEKSLPSFKIPKYFLKLDDCEMKWPKEKLNNLAESYIDEIKS